jgi:DNA-binding MarR family transcriptional regulator
MMSFAATLWAWKQEDISSTQKLVLLDVCDRANAADQCWPQKTIAGRVRLTERAVCTALAALQQKGLIRRLPRIKFGKRTSDLITVLVASDKPEAKVIERKPPHKPPSAAAATIGPATEAASGDRRNFVQPNTGTSFSVISHTELPRSNLTSVSSLLELMPQSGRPDIDAHNSAVWFLADLRSKIESDVDWSSGGIDNCTLLVDWLFRYGAGAVAATITATAARRRQTRPGDPIRSWSYFESEIAKLETEDAPSSGSGLISDIA